MNSNVQERLLSAIGDLGAAYNFEQALDLIVSSATELTHSQAASILEFNQATNQLHFLASSLPNAEQLETINIPLDVSAASWTFCNNLALILTDAKKDPRYFPVLDQTIGFNTESALTVPILYMRKTLGVIEVVNKTNRAHYTEEDTKILETLGVYCGALLWISMIEERIQSTREEIAELDSLKKNFIAITSHELRTPLGLILGNATFLREVIKESNREHVDAIIRNVSRLNNIVESLTNIDNYETGMATIGNKAVSLKLIIEDVAASFQDMAKSRDITIKLEFGNKNLLIEADANKITVALSNLLRNAITFSRNGSKVVILMESIQGFARVSVIDNGIGIPAGDLPKIFDRFYQVESHLTRTYNGMGLGLSVAKSMIEMLGGRIWVESEEGKGSNFTFTIPMRPKTLLKKVPAFTT